MAKRATNIGTQTEYIDSDNQKRATNIGVQVEYKDIDNQKRATNIGVQTEYLGEQAFRVTQEGFGVEYADDQAFRVTAIGFQIEYIEIRGKKPKDPPSHGPKFISGSGPETHIAHKSIPHLRI